MVVDPPGTLSPSRRNALDPAPSTTYIRQDETMKISSTKFHSRPRRSPRRWGLTLLVLATFSASTALAAKPIQVLTTIGMLGDVAAEVAGECAAVEAIMGPGVDPHLYRASAGDVTKLARADLILYAGLGLEGRLSDVLANFSRRKPTVAVAELAVPATELRYVGTSTIDPHVWMDVALWRGTAAVIRDALLTHPDIDPECAAGITARTSAYVEQLAVLDAWVREAVASIPERQRVLVTAHDAFQYFGSAYGLEVVGIQGISTDAEAAVADIRRVAEVVAQREVPAIFVESTINQRTVDAVIDAVRRRGASVTLGGQLYSDAMGADRTPDGTYIGMLVRNATNVVAALGGAVPALPRGLSEWEGRWQ